MTDAAFNIVVGATFGIGVCVGLVASAFTDILRDSAASNPQSKPRVHDTRGESQLRPHEKLATLSVRPNSELGEMDPAEFEKWQRNLRRAGKAHGEKQ